MPAKRIAAKHDVLRENHRASPDTPFVSTAPPKFARLVLSLRDLDFPIHLTMYNLIRKCRLSATRILMKGGTVAVAYSDGKNGPFELVFISSLGELAKWSDHINSIVITKGSIAENHFANPLQEPSASEAD